MIPKIFRPPWLILFFPIVCSIFGHAVRASTPQSVIFIGGEKEQSLESTVSPFAQESVIAAAEFFIDQDPGLGKGISIPAADGSFNSKEESVYVDVGTSALSVGFHTLGVRFQDSNGNWSITRKTLFEVKGENYITAAEYFIDQDPGLGKGIPVTFPGGIKKLKEVDLSVSDISTADLAVGMHTFYMRVRDKNGNWSVARQQKFEVAPPITIASAEYFVGNDPGVGNRPPLNPTDGAFDEAFEELTATFNLPGGISLEDKPVVYVRVFDSLGRSSDFATFTLAPSPTLVSPANQGLIRGNESILFKWDSVTPWGKYVVTIDNNFSDTTPPVKQTETADLSTTILLNLPDNLYYWQVEPLDADGNAQTPSEIWSFQLSSPAPSPVLIEPQDKQNILAGNEVILAWNAIPNASRYAVKIVRGTDLMGSSIVGDPVNGIETPETKLAVTIKDWKTGAYLWAVRAMGKSPAGYIQEQFEQVIGWGEYASRTFFVIPGGDVVVYPNAISVYDNPSSTDNLNGLTDYDEADARQLMIQWDIDWNVSDTDTVSDWHVYAQTDIYGYFYLGRTGDGATKVFYWPGSPGVDKNQSSGPSFGHTYRFRVYGLRTNQEGKLQGLVVGTQSSPTGYTMTGSAEMPVFMVSTPKIPEKTVMVTDDVFDITDLSNGVDIDDENVKALGLFWNVGNNTYWNYHIYVGVNGGPEKFMGQSGAGDVNYFRWSNIQLFSTMPDFREGPLNGNTYSFTIYGLLGKGMEKVSVKGPVNFLIQPGGE